MQDVTLESSDITKSNQTDILLKKRSYQKKN